jgi:hypothetical protein
MRIRPQTTIKLFMDFYSRLVADWMDFVFPEHFIIRFIENYDLFAQRKKEAFNLYQKIYRSNSLKLWLIFYQLNVSIASPLIVFRRMRQVLYELKLLFTKRNNWTKKL